jgi:hypothetical protein
MHETCSKTTCGIRRLFRNGVCDWSEADIEQQWLRAPWRRSYRTRRRGSPHCRRHHRVITDRVALGACAHHTGSDCPAEMHGTRGDEFSSPPSGRRYPMCYRVHDLDRPREKAAQQPTPTTLSLRPRLDERWAALMAWLRPSAKPAAPVTATSPSQAKPAEAAAKPVPRPLDQASTGASTSPEAREREAETV